MWKQWRRTDDQHLVLGNLWNSRAVKFTSLIMNTWAGTFISCFRSILIFYLSGTSLNFQIKIISLHVSPVVIEHHLMLWEKMRLSKWHHWSWAPAPVNGLFWVCKPPSLKVTVGRNFLCLKVSEKIGISKSM
jgi:hypothetical protein